MAQILYKTIFQVRRGTEEEWIINKDVVPSEGEPCFIIDKNILKIGDGITSFENLYPIGGVNITADGMSLILEDNTFKLFGFDEAETGAQPRKKSDGTIEWIVPSAETLEGLQTIVADLQNDVSEIQEILTPSEEGAPTLVERITNIENQLSEETSNYISGIKINGTLLETIEGKVDIPIASDTILGVVKSSNEITVDNEGALEIKTINLEKITQSDDLIVVLDGGSSILK